MDYPQILLDKMLQIAIMMPYNLIYILHMNASPQEISPPLASRIFAANFLATYGMQTGVITEAPQTDKVSRLTRSTRGGLFAGIPLILACASVPRPAVPKPYAKPHDCEPVCRGDMYCIDPLDYLTHEDYLLAACPTDYSSYSPREPD